MYKFQQFLHLFRQQAVYVQHNTFIISISDTKSQNTIFCILTITMKITLAVPLVCPELYSYMYFLDLSLHRITFVKLYTVCLLSTFTLPD